MERFLIRVRTTLRFPESHGPKVTKNRCKSLSLQSLLWRRSCFLFAGLPEQGDPRDWKKPPKEIARFWDSSQSWAQLPRSSEQQDPLGLGRAPAGFFFFVVIGSAQAVFCALCLSAVYSLPLSRFRRHGTMLAFESLP